MPTFVSITVLGDEQMARQLDRTGRYAEDMRPVWDVIAEDIRQIGAAQFDTEGQRSSGGWAPLEAVTIERKARQGAAYPSRILWMSGDLRDAVASPSHPDQIIIKDNDQLIFRLGGKSEIKGAVAQSGAPSKGIPQRRILEFTEMDRQRFMRDIQRYVVYGSVEWIDRVL